MGCRELENKASFLGPTTQMGCVLVQTLHGRQMRKNKEGEKERKATLTSKCWAEEKKNAAILRNRLRQG